jgi:hypothetical protein
MLDRILARSDWDRIPDWPPDVFACTSVLLHVTGAFRFGVSPPAGEGWPPSDDWTTKVDEAAREWVARLAEGESRLPDLVEASWNLLSLAREKPLEDLATGTAWDTCAAILTLHAVVDETMADLDEQQGYEADTFEAKAWRLLAETGSLSRLPASAIRVLPKAHLAQGGINLRSLSRHLSSHVSPVDVSWTRVPLGDVEERKRLGMTWNLLLLPWPLEVDDHDFRASVGPVLNMDPEAFGFFEFNPQRPLDLSYVDDVLGAAVAGGSAVHGVVLPEAAVTPDEIGPLEKVVAKHGAVFVATGVREPSVSATQLGRNYAHIGVRGGEEWTRLQTDKHHRWNLDASQVLAYGISEVLSPSKIWWEAISIPRRSLSIIDIGAGATASVLICEDLARLDEVAEVLRYVGPSLVVALLLDGPQLSTRWSSRYAGVLADDPGSAVLTLTSLGMVGRCRYGGPSGSRAVALWKDPERGLAEIELEEGAGAVLLTLGERRKTVWTADGRCHSGKTPWLVLDGVSQIPLPNRNRRSDPEFTRP